MKKICLISYYGIRDCIEGAVMSLKKFGFTVIDYPFLQHFVDVYSKVTNPQQHFINFINENKPDILLWWCWSISAKDLQVVVDSVRQRPFMILWNWDDPFCWTNPELGIRQKAPFFDLVVVTCKETLHYYTDLGVKNAVYSLPGFDPQVFYYDGNVNYDNDISFCCTNLYTNPVYTDQWKPRKKILDDLITAGFDIAIYGPEQLREYYPENYGGYAEYKQLNKIINRSKICLSLHVCSSYDGYINERTVLIAGAGGLLVIDPVAGITKVFNPEDIVVLQEDYVSHIQSILSDYSKLKQLRTTLSKFALDNLTWDNWAEKLFSAYSQANFNPSFYSRVFQLNYTTNEQLLQYWLKIGLKRKEACFSFTVPKSFTPQLNNKPLEYLWWYHNIHTTTQHKPEENSDKIVPVIELQNKMSKHDVIDLYSCFKQIDFTDNLTDGLIRLGDVYKGVPGADINESLESYLSL